MRIAFLSTFYPFRGGIAQFSASLYRELEGAHEVKAFTFTRQYPDRLFPGDTQYVTDSDNADPIPSEAILDTINPFSYMSTARHIRAWRPDLLIMTYWMPFFAPSLGWAGASLRRAGVNVVSVLHNVIPHERRRGDLALTRYFLKRNDGFVVMARAVEQDLLRLKPNAVYRLKPHPIYSHFGNTIDRDQARATLGIPPDKKVLLFFGFIRDYKGLDNIIRAMPHLGEDYLLLVAGECYGEFADYQRVIDETGAANKINLHVRYIDDKEVTTFFSASDVGILPYKSATQSGIAQVAYNFDLPLIATNVGGLAEMVEDGVTGLIMEGQNERDLASRIQYYFDERLAERFSRAIAENKEAYSWSGFAGSILAVDAELRARQD